MSSTCGVFLAEPCVSCDIVFCRHIVTRHVIFPLPTFILFFFLPLLLNSLFAFQVTIHCPLFIFMDVQTCPFLFTRCLNSTALSRCLNFSTCTILCGCVSRGTQINGLRNWAKQARVWEASSYTFKRLSPIFIGHLVAQPYFPPYVLYYLQTLIPNEPLIINFFLKKI